MNTQAQICSGSLILVNGQYPCRQTLSDRSLVSVGGQNSGILLERRCARLLDELMGQLAGWRGIAAVSGWRSMQEQQQIWEQSMLDNGEEFTKKYVASPGHSEHQTGLAIDLGLRTDSIDFIRPAFPYSGICQTFRRRAAAYGFVERYPAGKEHITGIAHEPWHFRCVGIPHAQIMTQRGLVLEEYLALLRQYPYGKRPLVYEEQGRRAEISFLPAEECSEAFPACGTSAVGGSVLDSRSRRIAPFDSLPGGSPGSLCIVSGNNADGFIVTVWQNSAESYPSPGTKSHLRSTDAIAAPHGDAGSTRY